MPGHKAGLLCAIMRDEASGRLFESLTDQDVWLLPSEMEEFRLQDK